MSQPNHIPTADELGAALIVGAFLLLALGSPAPWRLGCFARGQHRPQLPSSPVLLGWRKPEQRYSNPGRVRLLRGHLSECSGVTRASLRLT